MAAPGSDVLVRKRGHWYHIDDEGAAVEAAGAPPGWLVVAERVVAEVGLNVNRRGVVFVSAVEGRDIETLTQLVADTSRDVYNALLEIDEVCGLLALASSCERLDHLSLNARMRSSYCAASRE